MATGAAFRDGFGKPSDSSCRRSMDAPRSSKSNWSNAKHRFDDLERAANIEQALRERNPSLAFAGAELGMMNCAEKLAMRPSEMSRSDIQALRGAVLDDGRILETLQTGRHLNGRGVSNQCDIVSTPATTNHRPAAMIPPNSRCWASSPTPRQSRQPLIGERARRIDWRTAT